MLAYEEEACTRAEAEEKADGRRPLFSIHGAGIERAEPQERPHGAHEVSERRQDPASDESSDAPPDVPSGQPSETGETDWDDANGDEGDEGGSR